MKISTCYLAISQYTGAFYFTRRKEKELIDIQKSKNNNILLLYKRTVKPGKKECCPLFSFYKEMLGKKYENENNL